MPAGPLDDALVDTRIRRMMHRNVVRTAQHRAERNVQIAQTALKRGFVPAVLLRRRLFVGMPRRMRERALLREQQQKD